MLKIWTGGAAAVVLLAATCAHAQDAVQWRVEDGGNGHWYEAIHASGLGWTSSEAAAAGKGGHLATITSESENGFVGDIVTDDDTGRGWWIGGRWNASEESWTWITGEEWSFESWGSSKLGCNNQPDGRDAIDIYCIDSNGDARWSDDFLDWPNAFGYVAEWSADCNEDGIVDYGQILDRTYADEDGNGVPDCCEGDCPGDLNGDDTVGPPDLGILLAVWGTDGGKIAGADINEDGTVNAADLGLLVGAWGDCGCN
jgi:hypothetical protein